MHVLDHQHGRRSVGQRVGHGGEHDVGRAVAERSFEVTAGPADGVAQRAERARCEQVVAAAGQHLHLLVESFQTRAHDTGLADAGLAGDQHRGALPVDGPVHGHGEGGDRVATLQQAAGHGPIVPGPAACRDRLVATRPGLRVFDPLDMSDRSRRHGWANRC